MLSSVTYDDTIGHLCRVEEMPKGEVRASQGTKRWDNAKDRASLLVWIGLAIGTCVSPTLSLNMDGQRSDRSRSRSSTDRTSSAMSYNPRIFSHVSVSTKESQDYASWDRQSSPATILLCGSKSSQSSLVPKEHQMFMEEAYNSAICFKMLRDTGTLDPLQIKYITKKMRKMAQRSPSMVMESIHDYFKDNPEISSRHRFRLFQVLQAVIGVPDVLEEKWQRDFMQLALEHMTKSTGIALTVGLAAVRHLDDAWAVLEQFGRSTPIKWSLQNFSLKALRVLHLPNSALRPPIDVDKKSRLLSICFCSVFALPLLDALEKHTCLFLEPPNIQGLYNQTMEAVDHMLQCFMMQNPTTNELYFLLSEIMNHLSMAELTDLIWTAIDGLGSTSNSWVQAAANMLFLVIQEHGGNLTTVRGWGPTQDQGGEGHS
ncbi:maestro heat-like repeat family member 5 [Cricetulus griseus]